MAEGFKVLETTKNISILLAVVQVFNIFLLLLIFAALIALLITTNPDLDHERRVLVTPIVQWFTSWITDRGSRRYLALVIFIVLLGSAMGAGGAFYMLRKSEMEAIAKAEKAESGELEEETNGEEEK